MADFTVAKVQKVRMNWVGVLGQPGKEKPCCQVRVTMDDGREDSFYIFGKKCIGLEKGQYYDVEIAISSYVGRGGAAALGRNLIAAVKIDAKTEKVKI
jgi:hypothetical protein